MDGTIVSAPNSAGRLDNEHLRSIWLKYLSQSLFACVGAAFSRSCTLRMARQCTIALRLMAHQEFPQSLHLFTPAERDHFPGNGPLLAPDHRPKIAGAQNQPSHDERLLRHLVNSSANFPERMASESVILSACPESRLESTVLGGPDFPMVLDYFLRKGPGFPTLHPGGENCNMIDAAILYGHVSANVFEAFPSE